MGKTMRFDRDQMESLHKYYVAKNKAKKNRKNKGDNMVNIKGDKIEVYEEKENKGEEMKNVNENIEAGLKAGLEAMDRGETNDRELTDAEKAQLEESLKAYEAAAIAAKEAVFAAIEKGEKMENFDQDFAHLTDEQKETAKKFLSENADAIENVRKYAEEKAKEFFSSTSEAAEEVAEATADFVNDAASTASDFAQEAKEDVKAAVEETVDNGGSKWLRRLGYVAATAVVAVGGYALYKRFGGESVAEEAVAELIESFRK